MTTFNKIYKYSRIWILLIIAIFLPRFMPNRYYQGVVNTALIFAILSLSLNTLSGCTGLFCVGFVAFYGIGAYGAAILTTRYGWPILLSLLAGGVISMAFSFLLGLPTMRLRGMYFAVATLAFGEIMHQLFVNWVSVTGGSNGIKSIPAPNWFGISFRKPENYYYILLVASVITIILTRNLINSRPGRAMLSIRENDIAAEAMGVDVPKYKMLAFAVSTFFAGVAGGLFAFYARYVDPTSFVNAESSAILAMMVVGGIGSISGSFIGGLALSILPEMMRFLGNIRLVLYGLAVVVIIIFAPKGIGGLIDYVDGVLCGTIKVGQQRKPDHEKTAEVK